MSLCVLNPGPLTTVQDLGRAGFAAQGCRTCGAADGYSARLANLLVGNAPGDAVLALPSSGVHSNGFSLVRRVFNVERADLHTPIDALGGLGLGQALLTPTRIYVKAILALLEQVEVHGISHITGGGFYENVPRSIPQGLCAKLEKSALRVPPIFDLIAETGAIPERDMFNTFNMGVGMTVTVPKSQADKALSLLRENGEDAYLIGEIVTGEERVVLC